jgi:ceramide glucosyltransferase
MNFPLLVIPLIFVGWLCLIGQLVAALRFAARPLPSSSVRSPVTILKPLYGAEPGLYENLRSFAEQDYPVLQLVLGVTDPADGAVAEARALIRDLPESDISLVIDRRIRGSNRKVANLENMLPAARHDLLLLADSDIRVERGYLAAVTAPFSDPGTGAVTCLYKAVAPSGLWSQLGAMQINFAFLPNALMADAVGLGAGCFGATIVLSRQTLARIGGFASLRDQLADDRRLGEAVRKLGLKVRLSRYLVENRVYEPSFAALWHHELRWARTLRQMAPLGYAGSVVTHVLALALLAMTVSGFAPLACVLAAVTLLGRVAQAAAIGLRFGLPLRNLWLLPLRDGLSFAIFVASFLGRRIRWRDRSLRLEPSGRMTVAE